MRAPLTVLFLCLSTAGAIAKPGQCLLEVDNSPKLIGRCNVDLEADGSFTIGAGSRPSEITYFGMVQLDPDGSAVGYWNGTRGATHAHDNLGALKRKGACWENDRSRVCAWKTP